MRKGEFDLTGKAIDCSGLPALGNAGKEIFRALKVACNGVDDNKWSDFSDLDKEVNRFLFIDQDDGSLIVSGDSLYSLEVIHPSDVLGQAAIDAAMDGATIVFEGDVIPSGNIVRYWADGAKDAANMVNPLNVSVNKDIIAYKILDVMVYNVDVASVYLGDKIKEVKFYDRALTNEGLNQEEIIESLGLTRESKAYCPPSIESRILAEKVGAPSVYDDLWDAHLELIQENMALTLELETANLKIKNLHRAINDAKAAIDV